MIYFLIQQQKKKKTICVHSLNTTFNTVRFSYIKKHHFSDHPQKKKSFARNFLVHLQKNQFKHRVINNAQYVRSDDRQ